MLTVNDLLTVYGEKKKIAKIFAEPVTPQAVNAWKDGPIPPARELEIRMDIHPGKVWPSDKNNGED